MEDKALGDKVDGVLASLDIEHPTARDANTLIDFYRSARAEAYRQAAGLLVDVDTWDLDGEEALEKAASMLHQRAEAEERGS